MTKLTSEASESRGSMSQSEAMPFFSMNFRAVPWAVGLFVTEVLIALYVRDRLVRPYGGDFLAVILVYCGMRVFAGRVSSRCLGTMAFAIGVLVEVVQLLNVPARLGLSHYPVLSITLGTTFEWRDLLASALGVLLVTAVDEHTELIRNRCD